MKIILSKSQWEFIGKKAGWFGKYDRFDLDEINDPIRHEKFNADIENNDALYEDIPVLISYYIQKGTTPTMGDDPDTVHIKEIVILTNKDVFFKDEVINPLDVMNLEEIKRSILEEERLGV